MTDEQINAIARELEPALRDWLSDRLLDAEVEPLDGVRVMRAVAGRLCEHMKWLERQL